MTFIHGGAPALPLRATAAQGAAEARAGAAHGTGAHLAWDNAAAMSEEVMMRLDSLAMDIEAVNAAKVFLENFDAFRNKAIEVFGTERGEAHAAFAKSREEAVLSGAPRLLASAPSRFGAELPVSGKLVEVAPDGGLTLGRFSIEGSGDGMAMRLDSERGLVVKERGEGWAHDGGAAARLIAGLRARMDNRPTLASPVLSAIPAALPGPADPGAAAALAVLRASGPGQALDKRV